MAAEAIIRDVPLAVVVTAVAFYRRYIKARSFRCFFQI